MATLSFNARFADRVQSGEKLHSIRTRRKRPQDWLPGKRVHLFTGMRTKYCRKLGIGAITETRPIVIMFGCLEIDSVKVVAMDHLDAFAKADGFTNWLDFVTFFEANYGLPWSGELIKWELEKSQ